MKTVIAGLLALAALSGCVAVPYGAPGVYVAPPAPVYYYGGHRHYYHRHHYHHHHWR